jgi:hypothetical protein
LAVAFRHFRSVELRCGARHPEIDPGRSRLRVVEALPRALITLPHQSPPPRAELSHPPKSLSGLRRAPRHIPQRLSAPGLRSALPATGGRRLTSRAPFVTFPFSPSSSLIDARLRSPRRRARARGHAYYPPLLGRGGLLRRSGDLHPCWRLVSASSGVDTTPETQFGHRTRIWK